MIVIVQLKKYVPGTSVFCIIIGKFSHWQKPRPIILFKTYECLKMSLHSAVLCFGLAIGLWVKSS